MILLEAVTLQVTPHSKCSVHETVTASPAQDHMSSNLYPPVISQNKLEHLEPPSPATVSTLVTTTPHYHQPSTPEMYA